MKLMIWIVPAIGVFPKEISKSYYFAYKEMYVDYLINERVECSISCIIETF